MILGKSRVKYTEFTSRCDLSSLERCIVNVFSYFGGMPENVLTDNMKTVVTGREAGKPIWNTRFADFCRRAWIRAKGVPYSFSADQG